MLIIISYSLLRSCDIFCDVTVVYSNSFHQITLLNVVSSSLTRHHQGNKSNQRSTCLPSTRHNFTFNSCLNQVNIYHPLKQQHAKDSQMIKKSLSYYMKYQHIQKAGNVNFKILHTVCPGLYVTLNYNTCVQFVI